MGNNATAENVHINERIAADDDDEKPAETTAERIDRLQYEANDLVRQLDAHQDAEREAQIEEMMQDIEDLAAMQKDLEAVQQEQEEAFAGSTYNVAQQEDVTRIKQGWLAKQSKHLGVMRRRWTVLQDKHGTLTLNTYQQERIYENPTESITLNANIRVEAKNLSDRQFLIYNEQTKQKFTFEAQSSDERKAWMDVLSAKCKPILVSSAPKREKLGLYNAKWAMEPHELLKDEHLDDILQEVQTMHQEARDIHQQLAEHDAIIDDIDRKMEEVQYRQQRQQATMRQIK